MRDFPALLQFATVVEEVLRLVGGRLGATCFFLRRQQSVEGAHHRNGQSTGRDLGSGPGHRLRCSGAPVICELSQANHLLNSALANVFVGTVVGDEPSRRRAIAFGVDEAVVVIDAREQRRTCLHAVFASHSQLSERRLKLRAVGLSARQSIGQRKRNSWSTMTLVHCSSPVRRVCAGVDAVCACDTTAPSNRPAMRAVILWLMDTTPSQRNST